MQLHVQHVLEGRTEQDRLAEVMLKSGGFMLTAPVEEGDAGRREPTT
ncbi:MAG: hypothetical protein R2817_05665 [Flavobacteriales bacterium]